MHQAPANPESAPPRASVSVRVEDLFFGALMESMPQQIFIKDRNLNFIRVNQRLAGQFGIEPGQIQGKSDFDLFPKDVAEQFREADQRVISQRISIVNETIFGPAAKRVQIARHPAIGADGNVVGVIGLITEITESERATVALKRSEQEFRRVWDNSLDGMRITDEDGVVVLVNQAFCRMVGKTRAELEGRPFSVIYRFSNPEAMQARHKERFAARNIEPLFERELLLWNGDRVWFELSNSFIELEGQPPHLLSIFRDITERKLAEEKLRVFAARLEQSNRELQDFAYIASHDLQEPLRKVTVFGDRLKTRFGQVLGSDGCDYLDRMLKASERMQALINGLLSFSRVTSKAQPFVEVDLNKVAHDMVADLETRIEQVRAKIEIAALPTIEAEPLQMRQLLQNLVGNALKFHRPEVPPVVRIQAELVENGSASQSHLRRLVQLTVSDNGIGFEEKYAERIFQVFQRLHSRATYEGTGMGLAIARKIVDYHGGSIVARSKLGEGSCFIVKLPLKQAKPSNL